MPTHLTVRGLVIRTVDYSETDKLCDLLTENGLLTVRARGARKPASKFAATTQHFAYGDYCLRQSGERYYLDSAVSRNLFMGLRGDLKLLALASYFSELIQKTATDQPQPQLLRLFVYALYHLSEHDREPEEIKPVFELRLMTELGLMPQLVCCPVCMNYLPPRPVMRLSDADFICDTCLEAEETDENEAGAHAEDWIPVTASVLQAVRHIVLSEEKRLFQFRIKGESQALLMQYAEKYTLFRLGRGFRTLKFYHDICGMETGVPQKQGNGKNDESNKPET